MSNLERFFDDCRKLGMRVSTAGFEDYLQDESRLRGRAAGLIKAATESDVADCVLLANKWGVPVTVVSGKTSLTGAPVPFGGTVLDVRALDYVDPGHPTVAGPGIVLKRYKDVVNAAGLFYPPDPTSEDSCTLGGNVACNASGPLSYLYGPTREYVLGLKIVLPTGSTLEIRRNQVVSKGGLLTIPAQLMSPPSRRDLVIPVPKIGAPEWSRCKSAAGLFSSEKMDLVDLFIGSEGILGVIVQIRTRLLPRRPPFFALMLYIPSREVAVELVTLLDCMKQLFHHNKQEVRQELQNSLVRIAGPGHIPSPETFHSVTPSCMEWLGASVAALLSDRSPDFHGLYGSLYVEQEHVDSEDRLEKASQWTSLVELFNNGLARDCGGIRADAALDETQIRRMKKDRQNVPERLNEAIRPGMVKVGTDFAVPMPQLEALLRMYDYELPPGKSYVFGHIGNAHLHANILAENDRELEQYQSLTRSLAAKVCKLGGTVSGEHGIGKLKREALKVMLGTRGVDEIKKIKKLLDPRLILNRGNMIVSAPDTARQNTLIW